MKLTAEFKAKTSAFLKLRRKLLSHWTPTENVCRRRGSEGQ